MKLAIYSIYDTAAKAYTRPFFLQNDGLAIRAFQDQVNAQEANNISEHPDQFTLFKLGEFDDLSGDILDTANESLGNGTQYVVNKTELDIKNIVKETLAQIG